MKNNYHIEDIDILVVGGGLAGLWAAIRGKECGARVVVADKGKIARSGVSIFCCGTMGPVQENEFHIWMRDLVEKSAYMVNQSLLEVVLRENKYRIEQMIEWGVDFFKDKSGKIHTEDGKGHKIIRSILYSGRQMMEVMRKEVESRGVEFRERLMITDLLTSDGHHPSKGQVIGAVGINTRTAQCYIFRTKAVIIASGLMSLKNHALYADGLCGDGQAMAFRAGAELLGVEFAPGHAFSLWNKKFVTGGQKQMLSENTRIINRLGERFMQSYMESARVQNPDFDGHVEFGDICRAMAIEIIEGRGPVYLNHESWSEGNIAKLRQVLPTSMKAFDQFSIDLRRELLEVTPFTPSYFSSCQAGIRINEYGQSSVEGLYAVGASSFVGQAVTPQACCNVFGYRAGEKAAFESKYKNFVAVPQEQVEFLQKEIFSPFYRKEGVGPSELFLELNTLVAPYKMIFFKSEKRIREILDKLESLERGKLSKAVASDYHELVKIQEFKNALTLMKLIYRASLERKESRFSHYREEYPFADNQNWLKWIIVKNDEEKGSMIKVEPIPFHLYKIKAPLATQKPSCTQYSFVDKTETPG